MKCFPYIQQAYEKNTPNYWSSSHIFFYDPKQIYVQARHLFYGH